MIIKEVAKRLKITTQTIRIWENVFNISVPRDEQNNRIYDESIINTFEQIKALKDQKQSITDIKNTLEFKGINEHKPIEFNPLNDDNGKPGINSDSKIEFNSLNLRDDIRSMIKAEIQEQTELSEKYAKATYKIGQLEAQLNASEEKNKLLPSPDELIKLKTELEAVKRENELLKMPWYKRFFVNLNYAKA